MGFWLAIFTINLYPIGYRVPEVPIRLQGSGRVYRVGVENILKTKEVLVPELT